MLDGVIIVGNSSDRVVVKTIDNTSTLKNKLYFAVLFSVFVHVIIALLLFFFAEQQPIQTPTAPNKAIKSYLYKKTAKPVLVEEKQKQEVINQAEIEVKAEILHETAEVTEQLPLTEKHDEVSVNTQAQVKAPPQQQESQPIRASFSAYQQLDSLRNAINENITSQEFSKQQQFRSPSVMHGKQIPVPHSEVVLTPEQKREQNTTKMSDDISITKYDNGICTIEREQFLGSPVEGSSSAFVCGESKFDKSFRQHMKKVQEKLLPTNSK